MTETRAYDPRTGAPIGQPIADTSVSELDGLVRRAAEAGGEYRTRTWHQRAALLERIAATLEGRREHVVLTADSETGLGIAQVEGEFVRVTDQLRLFAAALRSGELLKATCESTMTRILLPIGPVAVFTAGNFPLAFGAAGGDVVAALAAGCSVVVKAHPGHPRTDRLVCELIKEALCSTDIPVDTVVLTNGLTTGRYLVRHPRIRAASFTGSPTAGRELFDLAASRPDPIPFYGELGSLNPVIVLPEAARVRTEELAAGFIQSLTSASGQMCTKPGLVFVPHDSALLDVIAQLVADLPAFTMLNENVAERFHNLSTTLARDRAVRRVIESTAEIPQSGYWQRPMLLQVDARRLTNDIAAECFGPFAVLATYTSVEHAFAAVDRLEGQLAAAIHAESEDFGHVADLLPKLADRVGRLVWNGWPTGVGVGAATHHGGPWPATTAPTTTSVGLRAVDRFLRPVCLQGLPLDILPAYLKPTA